MSLLAMAERLLATGTEAERLASGGETFIATLDPPSYAAPLQPDAIAPVPAMSEPAKPGCGSCGGYRDPVPPMPQLPTPMPSVVAGGGGGAVLLSDTSVTSGGAAAPFPWWLVAVAAALFMLSERGKARSK